MTRVAFIGLGVMGYPMAGHLARAGYQVVVFNRDPAKSRRWVAEYGGEASTAAARATPGAHAVFCCLGNDQSVREVVLGENGLLAAMEPGAVLVDHTTASAGLARELERAAAQYSIGFVDAPVSGGEAGARKGILTVMAGGSAENFARIEPMLGAYAVSYTHLRAHETVLDLVCRLLLEKKKQKKSKTGICTKSITRQPHT